MLAVRQTRFALHRMWRFNLQHSYKRFSCSPVCLCMWVWQWKQMMYIFQFVLWYIASSLHRLHMLLFNSPDSLLIFSSECFSRDVPWWTWASSQSCSYTYNFQLWPWSCNMNIVILCRHHREPSGVGQVSIFIASNSNSALWDFKAQVTVRLEICMDIFHSGAVPPMPISLWSQNCITEQCSGWNISKIPLAIPAVFGLIVR